MAMPSDAPAETSDNTNKEAIEYLTNLLGKILRIQISDGRMFVGQMKCTDKDRNVILAKTKEYRGPSPDALAATEKETFSNDKVTSRFVGLIVVPGEYITKVEIEDFDPTGII